MWSSNHARTRIVVAQPMCSPIRGQIMTALRPYGFKGLEILSYSESDGAHGDDGATYTDDGNLVRRNVGVITVNAEAARWCEYLLLRTGEFALLTPPLDERNRKWAARHNGRMPIPWEAHGPCAKAQRQAQPARSKRTKAQRRDFWWWLRSSRR